MIAALCLLGSAGACASWAPSKPGLVPTRDPDARVAVPAEPAPAPPSGFVPTLPAPVSTPRASESAVPPAAPQPEAVETSQGPGVTPVEAAAPVEPSTPVEADATRPEAAPAARGGDPGELTDAELDHLLAVARSLVGYRRVKAGGGLISLDCSGFVRAVYLALGINLFAEPEPGRPPSIGGVGLILWNDLVRGVHHGLVDRPENFTYVPRRGDVVYFHHTADRNRNHRLDDPYTHVGLVEGVDDDGTVRFLDASAGTPVKLRFMNLRHPSVRADASGKVINTPMRVRWRRDPTSAPSLAGALFAGFGTIRRPPGSAPWMLATATPVFGVGRPWSKELKPPRRRAPRFGYATGWVRSPPARRGPWKPPAPHRTAPPRKATRYRFR